MSRVRRARGAACPAAMSGQRAGRQRAGSAGCAPVQRAGQRAVPHVQRARGNTHVQRARSCVAACPAHFCVRVVPCRRSRRCRRRPAEPTEPIRSWVCGPRPHQTVGLRCVGRRSTAWWVLAACRASAERASAEGRSARVGRPTSRRRSGSLVLSSIGRRGSTLARSRPRVGRGRGSVGVGVGRDRGRGRRRPRVARSRSRSVAVGSGRRRPRVAESGSTLARSGSPSVGDRSARSGVARGWHPKKVYAALPAVGCGRADYL